MASLIDYELLHEIENEFKSVALCPDNDSKLHKLRRSLGEEIKKREPKVSNARNYTKAQWKLIYDQINLINANKVDIKLAVENLNRHTTFRPIISMRFLTRVAEEKGIIIKVPKKKKRFTAEELQIVDDNIEYGSDHKRTIGQVVVTINKAGLSQSVNHRYIANRIKASGKYLRKDP